MFILSVEGPEHADKGTWSTHAVLAANPSREVVVAFAGDRKDKLVAEDSDYDPGEEILLLTEITGGGVKKVERL